VISANNGHGIEIFGGGSPNNLITGNFIGTDAKGTVDMGNNGWGVESGSSGTTIQNNVIADNGQGGIHAAASGIVIQGNDIGTDLSGTLNLGNPGSGVYDTASDVQIGGTGAGQGNVIAYNGFNFNGPGVGVDPGNTSVAILSNSIFGNTRLGIDLNNNGVTPNHQEVRYKAGPITIRTTRSSRTPRPTAARRSSSGRSTAQLTRRTRSSFSPTPPPIPPATARARR
jgi:parallel beta-helix repeat protein